MFFLPQHEMKFYSTTTRENLWRKKNQMNSNYNIVRTLKLYVKAAKKTISVGTMSIMREFLLKKVEQNRHRREP